MTAPARPAPADRLPGTCAGCGAALRTEDVRARRHPAMPWIVLGGALLGVAFLFVPPLPFVFDGTRGSVRHAMVRVALPAFVAGYVASLLPRRRTCACRSCGTVASIRP